MRMAQDNNSDALAVIHRRARAHFISAPGSHDWEHTLRVHRLCLALGPKAGADMTALEAAAYLHDIGRSVQDSSSGSVCHAVKGAEMAAVLLEELNLDEACKLNIIHCIRSHRYRNDHRPESIEARILFDADKLDAIGAVGVARAYLFAGELGACLHNPHLPVEQARPYSRNDTGYREYVVKLSKIRQRMLTAEGRRMADERHDFMVRFFKRFLDEYDARC
jgi:uncharacterized protein